jgi:hypothetical protein
VHATIHRYSNVAGSTDQILAAGRRVTAALGLAPGFISWCVVDAGDGSVISISVFQTQSELEHGNRLLGSWLSDDSVGSSLAAQAATTGEVIIQKGL